MWKPAGLASELRDDRAADSVRALVARRFPHLDPKLPHRLDRVTRGILLVCLTPESIAFHNAQIKAGRWHKHYLARVEAPMGRAAETFLGEHRAFLKEEKGRARLVRSGGKPARLEIVAISPVPGRPDRWHLVIRLLTGRFHQIRVMCAHLGLPLAGDPLYDPKQRDPDDFYLEHVILRYERCATGIPSTIFQPTRADRGPIDAAITTRLAQLAAS